MLVALTPGATFVFGLVDDVGAFLVRQRPAALLRLVGDVRVVDGGGGAGGKGEKGDQDDTFHSPGIRKSRRNLDIPPAPPPAPVDESALQFASGAVFASIGTVFTRGSGFASEMFTGLPVLPMAMRSWRMRMVSRS